MKVHPDMETPLQVRQGDLGREEDGEVRLGVAATHVHAEGVHPLQQHQFQGRRETARPRQPEEHMDESAEKVRNRDVVEAARRVGHFGQQQPVLVRKEFNLGPNAFVGAKVENAAKEVQRKSHLGVLKVVVTDFFIFLAIQEKLEFSQLQDEAEILFFGDSIKNRIFQTVGRSRFFYFFGDSRKNRKFPTVGRSRFFIVWRRS